MGYSTSCGGLSVDRVSEQRKFRNCDLIRYSPITKAVAIRKSGKAYSYEGNQGQMDVRVNQRLWGLKILYIRTLICPEVYAWNIGILGLGPDTRSQHPCFPH